MSTQVTRSQAMQYAKNYRGSKASLQHSIRWATEQAMAGNADGIYMVMLAAGMISGRKGEMTTLADGRQLWKYFTAPIDDGGLGMAKLIRWDKELSKFKMTKGAKAATAELDVVTLMENLHNNRWDQYKSTPANKAFDLDKAITNLVTRAANNGLSADDVTTAFLKLAEAA